MLTSKKTRWALSLLENAKSFIEKAYPNDTKLIGHLRDAILIICYKIQQEEEKNEK